MKFLTGATVMIRHPFMIALLLILVSPALSIADAETVQLPNPQLYGGMPLMEAFKKRASCRSYSSRELSLQVLSNLLWAAYGINRPDSGKRTAPSSRNRQMIDIYVVTGKASYLYDAKKHFLISVEQKDVRFLCGTQDFVKDSPLNLVYVADTSRIINPNNPETRVYLGADTGFISQNVYLFCASDGLSTVVRAQIDRESLSKALKLRSDQIIILAQTIGYQK